MAGDPEGLFKEYIMVVSNMPPHLPPIAIHFRKCQQAASASGISRSCFLLDVQARPPLIGSCAVFPI